MKENKQKEFKKIVPFTLGCIFIMWGGYSWGVFIYLLIFKGSNNRLLLLFFWTLITLIFLIVGVGILFYRDIQLDKTRR